MVPVSDSNHASTGELISRLTRETTALVRAEVARLKLQASSIVVPAIGAGVLAFVGLGTFFVGLLAFGVALFAGVYAFTGSAAISGLVVGGAASIVAGIAAAVAAAMARAIPIKLKELE